MRARPRKSAVLGAVTAMLLAPGVARAQTTGGQARAAQNSAAQGRTGQPANPPPAPSAAAQTGTTGATSAQPAAGPRRDPFRPLVIRGRGGDELPARLPPGKAGLVIGQLTIQGIVRGLNGEWIAVVDNKTKRAYFLYAGDELYNGTVARITPESVVFSERTTDSLGRVSTREVVKRLNPT